MRTPPSKVVRILRLTSHVTRWERSTAYAKTVFPHEDYVTLIICGRELASDERLTCFDKIIFHDEVARMIAAYPEI